MRRRLSATDTSSAFYTRMSTTQNLSSVPQDVNSISNNDTLREVPSCGYSNSAHPLPTPPYLSEKRNQTLASPLSPHHIYAVPDNSAICSTDSASYLILSGKTISPNATTRTQVTHIMSYNVDNLRTHDAHAMNDNNTPVSLEHPTSQYPVMSSILPSPSPPPCTMNCEERALPTLAQHASIPTQETTDTLNFFRGAHAAHGSSYYSGPIKQEDASLSGPPTHYHHPQPASATPTVAHATKTSYRSSLPNLASSVLASPSYLSPTRIHNTTALVTVTVAPNATPASMKQEASQPSLLLQPSQAHISPTNTIPHTFLPPIAHHLSSTSHSQHAATPVDASVAVLLVTPPAMDVVADDLKSDARAQVHLDVSSDADAGADSLTPLSCLPALVSPMLSKRHLGVRSRSPMMGMRMRSPLLRSTSKTPDPEIPILGAYTHSRAHARQRGNSRGRVMGSIIARTPRSCRSSRLSLDVVTADWDGVDTDKCDAEEEGHSYTEHAVHCDDSESESAVEGRVRARVLHRHNAPKHSRVARQPLSGRLVSMVARMADGEEDDTHGRTSTVSAVSYLTSSAGAAEFDMCDVLAVALEDSSQQQLLGHDYSASDVADSGRAGSGLGDGEDAYGEDHIAGIPLGTAEAEDWEMRQRYDKQCGSSNNGNGTLDETYGAPFSATDARASVKTATLASDVRVSGTSGTLKVVAAQLHLDADRHVSLREMKASPRAARAAYPWCTAEAMAVASVVYAHAPPCDEKDDSLSRHHGPSADLFRGRMSLPAHVHHVSIHAEDVSPPSVPNLKATATPVPVRALASVPAPAPVLGSGLQPAPGAPREEHAVPMLAHQRAPSQHVPVHHSAEALATSSSSTATTEPIMSSHNPSRMPAKAWTALEAAPPVVPPRKTSDAPAEKDTALQHGYMVTSSGALGDHRSHYHPQQQQHQHEHSHPPQPSHPYSSEGDVTRAMLQHTMPQAAAPVVRMCDGEMMVEVMDLAETAEILDRRKVRKVSACADTSARRSGVSRNDLSLCDSDVRQWYPQGNRSPNAVHDVFDAARPRSAFDHSHPATEAYSTRDRRSSAWSARESHRSVSLYDHGASLDASAALRRESTAAESIAGGAQADSSLSTSLRAPAHAGAWVGMCPGREVDIPNATNAVPMGAPQYHTHTAARSMSVSTSAQHVVPGLQSGTHLSPSPPPASAPGACGGVHYALSASPCSSPQHAPLPSPYFASLPSSSPPLTCITVPPQQMQMLPLDLPTHPSLFAQQPRAYPHSTTAYHTSATSNTYPAIASIHHVTPAMDAPHFYTATAPAHHHTSTHLHPSYAPTPLQYQESALSSSLGVYDGTRRRATSMADEMGHRAPHAALPLHTIAETPPLLPTQADAPPDPNTHANTAPAMTVAVTMPRAATLLDMTSASTGHVATHTRTRAYHMDPSPPFTAYSPYAPLPYTLSSGDLAGSPSHMPFHSPSSLPLSHPLASSTQSYEPLPHSTSPPNANAAAFLTPHLHARAHPHAHAYAYASIDHRDSTTTDSIAGTATLALSARASRKRDRSPAHWALVPIPRGDDSLNIHRPSANIGATDTLRNSDVSLIGTRVGENVNGGRREDVEMHQSRDRASTQHAHMLATAHATPLSTPHMTATNAAYTHCAQSSTGSSSQHSNPALPTLSLSEPDAPLRYHAHAQPAYVAGASHVHNPTLTTTASTKIDTPAAATTATVGVHYTASAVEEEAAGSLPCSRPSSRLSLVSAHICSSLALAPLAVCPSTFSTPSRHPLAPISSALSAPSVPAMSSAVPSSTEPAAHYASVAYVTAGVSVPTDISRTRSDSLYARSALTLAVDTDAPSFPPSALSPRSLSSAHRNGPHAPSILSPPLQPAPVHSPHSPSFTRRTLGVSPTAQPLSPFAVRHTLASPSSSGSTASSTHDTHAQDLAPQPISPEVARRTLPTGPLSPSSQRRVSAAGHTFPSAGQPLSPALSRRSVFFLGSLPSLPEGEEEELRNSASGARHMQAVTSTAREWAGKEHTGGVGPAWGSERGFSLPPRPLGQSTEPVHSASAASGAQLPLHSSKEESRSTLMPVNGPHHSDAIHASYVHDAHPRSADWPVAAPASGASRARDPARHTLADAHAFSREASDASFAGSTAFHTHSPRTSRLSVRGRDTFASHRESCERMSGDYVVNTDGVRHSTIHGGHGGGVGYHNSLEPVIKSSSNHTPNVSTLSTPQHLHRSDAAASLPPFVEHATVTHPAFVEPGSPISASSRLSMNTASTLSRLRALTLSSHTVSPLEITDNTCADTPPPLHVHAGAQSMADTPNIPAYDPAANSPLTHAAFAAPSRLFSTHQTYRRLQQQPHSQSQSSHPQACPSVPASVEAQLLPRLQRSHRLQSDAVQVLHGSTPASLPRPAPHMAHDLPPLASHLLTNAHTQALYHPHTLPASSSASAAALGAGGAWRHVAPAPALMPGPSTQAVTAAANTSVNKGFNTASPPLHEQPVGMGAIINPSHEHSPGSQMAQQATPLPQLSPAPAYTPSSDHATAPRAPSLSPAPNGVSSPPPATEATHTYGDETQFFSSQQQPLHHSYTQARAMASLTPYAAKYHHVTHAREVTVSDSLNCSADNTCINGSLRTQTTLLRSSSTSLAPSLAKTFDQRLSTASAPAGTSAPAASHEAYTYATLSLRSSHTTGVGERSSARSFTTLAPHQLSQDLYAHPSAAVLLLAQTTPREDIHFTVKLEGSASGVRNSVDVGQRGEATDTDMNDDVHGFHNSNAAAPTPSAPAPSLPSPAPEPMHALPHAQLIPLVACPNVSLDDVLAMSAEELERLAATSLAPVESAVRGL